MPIKTLERGTEIPTGWEETEAQRGGVIFPRTHSCLSSLTFPLLLGARRTCQSRPLKPLGVKNSLHLSKEWSMNPLHQHLTLGCLLDIQAPGPTEALGWALESVLLFLNISSII